MIAVAWLFPEGKRLFDLFPEVIMVDVTMQTNKEDRPLFLLVIRDSQAKYIPILKIFLPNQKRWIFRWVFQNAIPSLLGKESLNKVQIMISDGDTDMYSQFDNAREQYYPNSWRLLCAFHLVDRAISNNGHTLICGKGTEDSEFGKQKNILKRWLYSFVFPSYESKEECNLSWVLFRGWLHSPCFVSAFGH